MASRSVGKSTGNGLGTSTVCELRGERLARTTVRRMPSADAAARKTDSDPPR